MSRNVMGCIYRYVHCIGTYFDSILVVIISDESFRMHVVRIISHNVLLFNEKQ